MGTAPDLGDYVQVNERLLDFYQQHPDGRVACAEPKIVVPAPDKVFIGVEAWVWRDPDDPQPCVAHSWEPFPGRTPYTRDSEAENAETSAVGRALALAGIRVNRSIATRDDVARRSAAPDEPAVEAPTAGEIRELIAALDEVDKDRLRGWCSDRGLPGKVGEFTPIQRLMASCWIDAVAAAKQVP